MCNRLTSSELNSTTHPRPQAILRKQSPWNSQKPSPDDNDHGRSTALAQTRNEKRRALQVQRDNSTMLRTREATQGTVRYNRAPRVIVTRTTHASSLEAIASKTSGTRPRSRIAAPAALKRAWNRSSVPNGETHATKQSQTTKRHATSNQSASYDCSSSKRQRSSSECETPPCDQESTTGTSRLNNSQNKRLTHCSHIREVNSRLLITHAASATPPAFSQQRTLPHP